MMEEAYMRATAKEGFSGRDHLTLVDLPIPEPGPDDVLVWVRVARVGPWDAKTREGRFGTRSRTVLRDVPDAELHLFDTGHFALEENLPEIAPLIATFRDRTWRPPAANQPRR
jgi:hypothetical protein